MDSVLFSSQKMTWETPDDFFKKVDDEFHFTCDVAADSSNTKCSNFFDKPHNSLNQNWTGICWCNPPYGREIGQWVKKASESKCTTVMLLPSRTDTKWFHEFIYHKAEIRFIKGRIKFVGADHGAPFPSMLVIFRNGESYEK